MIYAFTRGIDAVQRCLLDITGSIFADAFLGICAKIFFLAFLLLFFLLPGLLVSFQIKDFT